MKLIWSSEARFQLIELRAYIGLDNPVAARRVVSGIRESAERLRAFPEAGRYDPDLDARILSVPRSPYRLYYEIVDGHIVILAVWHGARQWPPASD